MRNFSAGLLAGDMELRGHVRASGRGDMSPRKKSGDASPHSKSALGWADFCPPRQALSRSPFSAVWKLRRFLQAGGRSLLMSIRAPLGRWIDRSVGRC